MAGWSIMPTEPTNGGDDSHAGPRGSRFTLGQLVRVNRLSPGRAPWRTTDRLHPLEQESNDERPTQSRCQRRMYAGRLDDEHAQNRAHDAGDEEVRALVEESRATGEH